MVRIDNPRVTCALTLLLMFALLLPFVGMRGEAPLAADDPVEAAAALEMARDADFSLRLAHESLSDLPPLYPMTAALMAHATAPVLSPISALRLTSALFGLGSLVLFYFFARRYGDRLFAVLAVALLATMPGYTFGSGCISSDPALGFFLMASVIATSRTFFDHAPHWILVGGMAAAGAFLTQAWGGLLLAGALWGAGLVWFLATQKPDIPTGFRYLFFHLAGLLALLALAGAGIATQLIGDPAPSWTLGFWMPTGHVGVTPGMVKMMARLLALTWPWAPLVCLYIGLTLARALRKQTVPATALFLGVWVLSALLALLDGDGGVAVILPPLALMAAFAFRGKRPEWVRGYTTLWSWLALTCLLLIALSPLLLCPLLEKRGPQVLNALLAYGPHTLIAAAGFILATLTCRLKTLPLSGAGRLLTITAILWVALSTGPLSAVALHEGVEVRPLITAIKAHPHRGIATCGVDRRLRATLLFYGQLDLPTVEELDRCYDILNGGDPLIDTLLVHSDSQGLLPAPLSLVPMTIVSELPLKQGGRLFWIKGI